MKKLMFVAALAALASGCVCVGPSNANSLLTLDVQSPDMSFVDNDVKPAKMGAAKAEGIICFCEGDASLKAAMDNGGIKKEEHPRHHRIDHHDRLGRIIQGFNNLKIEKPHFKVRLF